MNRHLLLGCSAGADGGGGIVSYVAALAGELSAAGHRVTIVSPGSATTDWQAFGASAWLDSGPTVDPRLSMQMILSLIHREGVTGVINNDHPYVQAIAPLSPVPVLSVAHAPFTIVPILACWNHAAVDHVVCISDDVARFVHRRFNLDHSRTPIVHNGIVGSLVREDMRPRAPGMLRAAFLGGSDRNKGADRVFRLATATLPEADRLQFLWAGALAPAMRRRVEGLRHVRLLGHLPPAAALDVLREADVILFPSRREGCPMALLEGMALGAVPIAADGEGAMREIVTDGISGFLVQPSHWVRRACTILQAPAATIDWDRLRDGARHAMTERFTAERTAAQLLELLDRPQVSRGHGTRALEVIDWHRRPAIGPIAGMPARLRYRLGLLKSLGKEQFTVSA